jgi:hypothetical protein
VSHEEWPRQGWRGSAQNASRQRYVAKSPFSDERYFADDLQDPLVVAKRSHRWGKPLRFPAYESRDTDVVRTAQLGCYRDSKRRRTSPESTCVRALGLGDDVKVDVWCAAHRQ